jgi:hypothetical protein
MGVVEVVGEERRGEEWRVESLGVGDRWFVTALVGVTVS